MKTFSIFFCVLFTTFSVFSQKNNNSEIKLIILDAKIDDVRISSAILKNNPYLLISEVDETIMFENSSSGNNEKSYGSIFDLETETQEETDSTYRMNTITFGWEYANTYDEHTGTAKVIIHIIDNDKGQIFDCLILTENLSNIQYKGYVEIK